MTLSSSPFALPDEELLNIWINTVRRTAGYDKADLRWLVKVAAQWGRDRVKADIERERQEAASQELEACRQWLEINGAPRKLIDGLRAARRPKPPSLKEQALKDVNEILKAPSSALRSDFDRIIEAIKQLPDNE